MKNSIQLFAQIYKVWHNVEHHATQRCSRIASLVVLRYFHTSCKCFIEIRPKKFHPPHFKGLSMALSRRIQVFEQILKVQHNVGHHATQRRSRIASLVVLRYFHTSCTCVLVGGPKKSMDYQVYSIERSYQQKKSCGILQCFKQN